MERWKDVPGYEGLYRVSDRGRVKNKTRWIEGRKGISYLRKARIMKPTIGHVGHLFVKLRKEGKYKYLGIHRLVLLAFVGPPPKGMQGRHFPDRNPANNRLENLSWSTQTTNMQDRFYHGTDGSGEKNGSAKLTNEEARLVLSLVEEDKLKYEHKRIKGCASYPYGRNVRIANRLKKLTGKKLTSRMISYIIRGKNWKRTLKDHLIL